MFAILKQLATPLRWRSSGKAWSRSCRTASASCARRTRNYLPGRTTSTSSPLADPPLRPAHGRTVEGPIRGARRRASALAPSVRSTRQFRGSREDPPQGSPLRQPEPLYPTDRLQLDRPDPSRKDFLGPDHRHRRPDRQGPARPHRRAAAGPAKTVLMQTSHSRSPRITSECYLIVLAHRRAAGGGHPTCSAR